MGLSASADDAGKWLDQINKDDLLQSDCKIVKSLFEDAPRNTGQVSEPARLLAAYLLGATDALEGHYSDNPAIQSILQDVLDNCPTGGSIRSAVQSVGSHRIDDLEYEARQQAEDEFYEGR